MLPVTGRLGATHLVTGRVSSTHPQGTLSVAKRGCNQRLTSEEDRAMTTYARRVTWPFFAAVAMVLVSMGLSRTEPRPIEEAQSVAPLDAQSRVCCCGRNDQECGGAAGGKCSCGTRAARDNEVALGQGLRRLELLAFAYSHTAELSQGEDQAKQEKPVSPQAKALGAELRKSLLNHQRALGNAYICCTMPGCIFCQTIDDTCPCGTNLRKGEPVCPECWGGWQASEGAIPGVRAADVKVYSKEQLKKLYERRAKKYKQVEE